MIVLFKSNIIFLDNNIEQNDSSGWMLLKDQNSNYQSMMSVRGPVFPFITWNRIGVSALKSPYPGPGLHLNRGWTAFI